MNEKRAAFFTVNVLLGLLCLACMLSLPNQITKGEGERYAKCFSRAQYDTRKYSAPTYIVGEKNAKVSRVMTRCNYLRQTLRRDWQKIMFPCLNLTKWNLTDQNLKKRYWTSAKRSLVAYKDQYNVGECINIKIYSATEGGRLKTIGGDSWRALLTGRSTEALDVVDNNDGTYDIKFSLYDEGSYLLELTLEYSMCNGLKDPPGDWFVKGNAQGRFQKEGTLGFLDDCRNEVMQAVAFQVIPSRKLQNHISQDQKGIEESVHRCALVWDGYGRWKDGYWRPYRLKDDTNLRKFEVETSKNISLKLNTLWIYGDSQGNRLYNSALKRPLCHSIFKNCSLTYTWVYPLKNPQQNENYDRDTWDDKDFNETKFLEPILAALKSKGMNDNRSVLLINFGLHLAVTLRFEQYKRLIASFIRITRHFRRKVCNRCPRIIWKTTTMQNKEGTKHIHDTQLRFLTLQRVQLFNAYTIDQMCKHGVETIDVYPISAARKADMIDLVHFDPEVFWPVEDMLVNYLMHQHTEERSRTD